MYAQDIGDKDMDDELFLIARLYKIGTTFYVVFVTVVLSK